MSTHDDDEFVIRANHFIQTSDDREAVEIVRGCRHRVDEKKVEIRGLEGQINTLKERVSQLEEMLVGD